MIYLFILIGTNICLIEFLFIKNKKKKEMIEGMIFHSKNNNLTKITSQIVEFSRQV